jgi:DNA polymerase-4
MKKANQLYIIHGDMDAFFAAVEQRDNPSLRGQPVIVGGNPDSRGVVSTCSYEARRYGVKSAMPLAQAIRLCPQAIFLPVNMQLYQQVSRQVIAIMAGYTPLVEQLSIDEAFLDVSGCTSLFGSAEKIARDIKSRVAQELGLNISMGISYNKFLAKLATELGKPDGLRVIRRDEIPDVLTPLPVRYIWGVGDKTLKILAGIGLKTIGDLRETQVQVLEKRLGSQARLFMQLANGIDERLVETGRESKSMGKEITFDQDVADAEYLDNVLLDFAQLLARRLRQLNLQARTVTLKIRYSDFQTLTRSKTIPESTNSEVNIYQSAHELISRLNYLDHKVRLIGLYLGKLSPYTALQQGLLFDPETEVENRELDKTLDQIRARFGEGIITRASLLGAGKKG